MTNTFELEVAMKKKGLTKTAVAKYLGLSIQGFLLKLNNQNQFKASEIYDLVNLLDIEYSVFFAPNVESDSLKSNEKGKTT